MTVIVTDEGFAEDDWQHGFTELDAMPANTDMPALAVHVPSDADPIVLRDRLGDIDLIRVDFPSFADGRGFTIGRALRLMGFVGRLRAGGALVADQYAMARRSGFDEVEIDAAMSQRQPEDQWRARANWRDHFYQARLGRADQRSHRTG
ncbi:MAG: DUF934 domain-containing protein [Pseudomonadota bacterium]